MSLQCPLCGKNKAEKNLFCSECTLKLNSEYEVNVPKGEDFAKEDLPEPENKDVEKKKVVDKTPVITESFDHKPKEETAWNNRTAEQKSYYEIERDKRPNRTLYVTVSMFILILAIVAAVFIYNQHVKDGNLERSVWELTQRDNSIDAYLDYIDEYPQGKYVDEAKTKMLTLKSNEADAWENLKTSENTIEFTDFLEKYPQSPYERMVKNRLDSLLWESSLKENSSQAYSDYINMSLSGEISGQYIGDAQKRFAMLTQTTPVDEADLEKIKETVNGFFIGLSNASHTELSNYLAPIVRRFNSSTNISNETMTGQLLLLAAKSDAKSVNFDPEITKLKYEKMESGTYTVDVPLQKTFDGNNGAISQIKGYIVHLKLNTDYKIYSYYETKPYSDAP
ncbi:MAG: hypothetical protein PHO84_08785 [Dysgonamonadaceae bacterium]|nr:hypothetical protein [Dysgonamonadaceae bacterium]